MKIDGKISNISMFCKALHATWCKTDTRYVYMGVKRIRFEFNPCFYFAFEKLKLHATRLAFKKD